MSSNKSKEKLTGLILIGCVIAALIIANSPLGVYLFQLMHINIPVGIGILQITKSAEHWINDGLMTIFFLLAGLEIKREMMHGELSSTKKASLPIFGAIGGMAVPALIYYVINYNSISIHGWAIPMATDIAFAIGIMALAGKYVPQPLRIFLVALAIVDDIGAILVIAFFYSHGLAINYLLYAALTLAFMFTLNRLQVRQLFFYIIPGIALWFFVYKSGIHSTIAGVLMALTIPYETKDGSRPLFKLEHAIHGLVNFLVLPLFALVNTAIVLKPEVFSDLFSTTGIGIFLGLFVGKPLGILLITWLAIKTNISQLPIGVNWKQMAGAGTLAGIGFTMSIFIALLSFDDPLLHDVSKMAILIASFFAAVTGFLLLKSAAKVES